MNIKALLALLTMSLVLGCGSEGRPEMPATDAAGLADTQSGGSAGGGAGAGGKAGGGGSMAVDGGAGGAAPGTGGAGQGGSGLGGAGGMPVTGGAMGTGGSTAGTGGAGGAGGAAPQPVLPCGSNAHVATGGCGYLVTAGQWEYLWKGDMVCGACTVNSKPVTGCKVAPPPPTSSNPPPQPDYILCVADCRAECCFKRPESVCTSDANCCAPLRCMDNGPSKNKTCR